MTWPPELGRMADLLDERDRSRLNYEWFAPDDPTWFVIDELAVGTRRGIAYALLAIPGVVMVGLADASNDYRVQPGTVALCLRLRNVVEDQLLRDDVEWVLNDSLSAGIRADIVYEAA